MMLRASGQGLADRCRVLSKLWLVAHWSADTRYLALSRIGFSRPRHLTCKFWSSLPRCWRVVNLASTFAAIARYVQALVKPCGRALLFAIGWFWSSSISLVAQLAWRGDPRRPGIFRVSLGGWVFHLLAKFRGVVILRLSGVGLHVGDLR